MFRSTSRRVALATEGTQECLMSRAGLAPQPLVSDGLVMITATLVAAAGIASGITASRWRGAAFVLVAALNQALYINKLGMLQELSARDVLLLLLFRKETDVQTPDVLVYIELVLAQSTALLALDGGVEGTQTINLHLLRVKQHLQQTAAELLQNTIYHVGGINASVLANVVRQLTGVQALQVLHSSVVLAIGSAVLILVLVNFINNLCHNFVCFFMVLDLCDELHRVTASRICFVSHD